MSAEKKVRIGVVGFGYWSPKLIRGFLNNPGADVAVVCDKDMSRWDAIRESVPGVEVKLHYTELIEDPTLEAIVITTTVSSHYRIAKAALEAGKHVLVEKPMTETVREARTLVAISKKLSRVLMVDHTFVFSPAVRTLKQTIEKGLIGSVHTVIGTRMNLGMFQKDIDVLYDLAPHDFSISRFIFGDSPSRVWSHRFAPLAHPKWERPLASVAYTTLKYENRNEHYIHSWISPIKERRMMFIGEKGALVYDMQDTESPLRLWNSTVLLKDPEHAYGAYFDYISGDAKSVPVPPAEGDDLGRVARHFLDAILYGQPVDTDGNFGLAVVALLQRTGPSLNGLLAKWPMLGYLYKKLYRRLR